MAERVRHRHFGLREVAEVLLTLGLGWSAVEGVAYYFRHGESFGDYDPLTVKVVHRVWTGLSGESAGLPPRISTPFLPGGETPLPAVMEPGTAVTEDGRIIKTLLPPAKVPKISVFMSDQVSLSELRAEVADLRKSTEPPATPTRRPAEILAVKPAPLEISTPEPPPEPNAEWEPVPDGSGDYHINSLDIDPCPWVGPVGGIELVPIDPNNPEDIPYLPQVDRTRFVCRKNPAGDIVLKWVWHYILATPTP